MKDIEYVGYYPGVVGKIIESHAVYYYENWGFDVSFETQVGGELSEFVQRFNSNTDGLWVAVLKGEIGGAIAIDGSDAFTEGARLRWFIVAPHFQGHGIGKNLIERAIEFCKQRHFPTSYLWTFQGLEDARRIYEAFDFRLWEENKVTQWGRNIIEQKYVLRIAYNHEGQPT